MIRKKGFTLIEVLISLSIFAYVFSALIILFFQFSKGTTKTEKCSSFSLILIQKILTESDNVIVSLDGSEVILDDQTLYNELETLHLFKNTKIVDFQKNKSEYQIDSCNVLFSKNTTSTSPLLNVQKCINIKYKQGKASTVCALK